MGRHIEDTSNGPIMADRRRAMGVWLTWKQLLFALFMLATLGAGLHLAIYRFSFEAAITQIATRLVELHDKNGGAHAALVEKVREMQAASDEKILVKLNDINERLARIEGRLEQKRIN